MKKQILKEDEIKEKQENLKKPSAGFLLEHKLPEENIQQRNEWIKTKRSQLPCLLKDHNRVTRKIHFGDDLDGLYSTKFSSDGETIATGYGSGCIQIRNAETGELRTTIRSGLETSLPVTCCRFHPIRKNTLYASSACGRIYICKLDQVEFYKFIEELDNELYAIDINVSGEYIFYGGKDTSLKVSDCETGQTIKKYKKDKEVLITENAVKYHHMKIFAIKCHQTDANLVVTGGWDSTIKIWDIRIGDGSVRSINGPHICGDAIDLREAKILTGSWTVRDSLQMWDMTSGKLIDTINPINRRHSSPLAGEFLYTAQFFDGDPYGDHVLVGGSATGCVEVINLKEKVIVGRYEAKKAIIAVDSHRSNIVYGGMDTVLNITEYN